MEPYTQIASDPKVSKLMQNNTMVDLVKELEESSAPIGIDWQEKKDPGSLIIMSGFGVENTLLNWFNNMVHISVLLSVKRWVTWCNKGPVAFIHMLNFLAYLKRCWDHF